MAFPWLEIFEISNKSSTNTRNWNIVFGSTSSLLRVELTLIQAKSRRIVAIFLERHTFPQQHRPAAKPNAGVYEILRVRWIGDLSTSTLLLLYLANRNKIKYDTKIWPKSSAFSVAITATKIYEDNTKSNLMKTENANGAGNKTTGGVTQNKVLLNT